MIALTIKEVREMADYCKANETKPRTADNGTTYFIAERNEDTIELQTPQDGTYVDVLTGERLVF